MTKTCWAFKEANAALLEDRVQRLHELLLDFVWWEREAIEANACSSQDIQDNSGLCIHNYDGVHSIKSFFAAVETVKPSH